MKSPIAAADAQAGFSVVEALVVLVISVMAILLAFAAARHAAGIGFRLGRGALDEADGSPNEAGLRALIAGLDVAPRGVDPKAVDLPGFAGDAARQAIGAAIEFPRRTRRACSTSTNCHEARRRVSTPRCWPVRIPRASLPTGWPTISMRIS